MIDFRSDTVTQPTKEMRKAMYESVVDDDVYGDDPTVNKLEKMAAEIMGKEAALFVPSGTMGNQIAIMTHTNIGDEIIVAKDAHIFKYEAGAFARLSGVSSNIISIHDGYMTTENIEESIRKSGDFHFPISKLLCLENPKTDGTVVPLNILKSLYNCAKEWDLKVHMDGARIFNAASYLGVDVKEISSYCDSVMFCLSKGLCAPVGSILCGDETFIYEARRMRKILGGGMRQAGVIAACGIVSLTKMTKRISIDNENAKYLANRLNEINGIEVNMDSVQTNMVFARIDSKKFYHQNYVRYMHDKGIKVYGKVDEKNNTYRFVTHNGIEVDDIDFFIENLKNFLDIEE